MAYCLLYFRDILTRIRHREKSLPIRWESNHVEECLCWIRFLGIRKELHVSWSRLTCYEWNIVFLCKSIRGKTYRGISVQMVSVIFVSVRNPVVWSTIHIFLTAALVFFLQGIKARVYETAVVLVLLAVVVCGLAWVASALLDGHSLWGEEEDHRKTLSGKC